MAVGDFNGDGNSDLALGNPANSVDRSEVDVLLGDGTGGFGAASVFSSGGGCPTSIAVGDFNGDGISDLAVANYYGGVSILLGDGHGGFSAPTTYSSGGSGLESVVVGDFNGDGISDLAVANALSGTVGVLLGNGDGTFSAPITFSSGGSFPSALCVGDFNGDGKSDLAVANGNSNTVGVLLGDGNGSFDAVRTFPSGGIGACGLVVGDFNGDGKSDLAVANNTSATVGVLLGYGNGSFVAGGMFSSGDGNPYSMAVGDFNGDGRSDLAVADGSSNTVSVLLNIPVPAAPTMTASVGTVTENSDGTWAWSYTPADDAEQPSTVTITADDGEPNGISSITFGLAVNNLPPTLTVDQPSVTAGEGQTASNTGTWSDGPADQSNVTLTASVGDVTKNDDGTWAWSYTPADDAGQPSTVTITADDGEPSNHASSITFGLTVNNLPPTLTVDQPVVTTGAGNDIGHGDVERRAGRPGKRDADGLGGHGHQEQRRHVELVVHDGGHLQPAIDGNDHGGRR